MAYADTLNALGAALGNPSIAAAPPSAQATTDGARPLTIHGGYADTLSALQDALGSGTGPQTAQPASTAPQGAYGSLRPMGPAAAPSPSDPVPQPQDRPPIPASDVPGDMLQSAASGIEKSALGLLSLPRTIHDAADAAVTYGVSKLTGRPVSDIQAHQAAADAGMRQDLGPIADVAAPTYDTLKNIDEAVAGPLYSPKSVPGDFAQTVGEFIPGAGANVVTGAVLPGVASEAAGQATKGTALEPYARTAGALVGGGVGAVGTGAIEAGKVGQRMLADYRLPATADGPAIIAGQRIQGAMSDPAAATAALGQDATLVPGSVPTTFQATGDLGLGQLERQLRTTNPQPFIQRDLDQNAARVGQLQAVQPTGSPSDIAARFRDIRDDIDQRSQAAVDQAVPAAQAASDAMGGFGNADSAGAALRGPLADARATAKDEESRLHGLVNPELGVPTQGVAQQAQQVMDSISPSATPLSGEEARIFNVASGYPDALRFGDVKDLRSAITDATAEARLAQNTQSVRRLTILRGAVDQALDHGVETQAGMDQVAVARGAMSPEDALEAKLRQDWAGDLGAYQANAAGTVARTGTNAGGSAGGGASGSSGAFRARGQTSGSFGQASGDQGIPPQTLPPATPEDVAAYRTANAATRQRAQTFDEGVIGDVLAPGARGGYDLTDAAVPGKLVPSGKPTDADVVRRFVAAGGSNDALADATAQAIRNKASLGDGTLDPGKVLNYLRQNRDALAEMPPEVASRFSDAATTQQTVNDAVVRRKALQAQFDKSALARVAGLDNGTDINNTIASIIDQDNGVQQMGVLARAAKEDPAAWSGLRRSVVETMFNKTQTASEMGGGGTPLLKPATTLKTFAEKMPILRQVFSEKEIGGMMAIKRDLDRATSIESLTRGNRGSSNSAQDISAASDGGHSIITQAIMDAAPAVAGKVVGGVPGAALAWLGAKTIGRGRAAGLNTANDLVLAGALDPALAKALVAKVPVKPDSGTADALGAQFARIARGTALGTAAAGPTGRQRRD